MDRKQRETWAIRELSILFAGQLAEARLIGRRPQFWRSSSDDSTGIDVAIRGCSSDQEAYLFQRWVFERTRSLVAQCWPQTLAVGEELAKRGPSGRLTGKEIRDTMQSTTMSGRFRFQEVPS
jgi:hypothetical protein